MFPGIAGHMIIAEKLVKQFDRHCVVDHVSFLAGKGDVLGLLGPNGAGKTTLLRMLATYLIPDKGAVTIAGHDAASEAEKVRSLIGYLPSQPPLYDDMRVEEYLQFIAGIRGLSSKAWKEVRSWVLELCELEAVHKKLCGTLSTGFRKRVGIAQALLHRPKLILLDEPYTGLDPEQLRQIRSLIQDFQGEHTFLISSHMLSEVAGSCNRILIMNRGRIIAEEEGMQSVEHLERRYMQALRGYEESVVKPDFKSYREVANS